LNLYLAPGAEAVSSGYPPWGSEKAIMGWSKHYNPERYHEFLDSVTPENVPYGRRKDVLDHQAIAKSLYECREGSKSAISGLNWQNHLLVI